MYLRYVSPQLIGYLNPFLAAIGKGTRTDMSPQFDRAPPRR